MTWLIRSVLSCLIFASSFLPPHFSTDRQAYLYVSAKLNYFLFHNCNTFPCVTHTLQMLSFLSRSPSPILLTEPLFITICLSPAILQFSTGISSLQKAWLLTLELTAFSLQSYSILSYHYDHYIKLTFSGVWGKDHDLFFSFNIISPAPTEPITTPGTWYNCSEYYIIEWELHIRSFRCFQKQHVLYIWR